jgi:YHS domain-containing protein
VAPESAWFKSSYSGGTGNDCVEVAVVFAPEAAWFKSSYSGDTGNDCVEVAVVFAPEEAWFKSSYSGDTGNSCVEVAVSHPRVGVRDSKAKRGPALVVGAGTWAAFVGYAAENGRTSG